MQNVKDCQKIDQTRPNRALPPGWKVCHSFTQSDFKIPRGEKVILSLINAILSFLSQKETS